MIENKKGLSTVVTTLIIILLVLVAIGIVWIVVRAFIETGVQTVDLTAKCLQIDLKATAVSLVSGTENYDVTLRRGSGGSVFNGVKFLFLDSTGATGPSSVIDSLGNIEELATITKTIDGEFDTADTVEVTPYFIDSSGNQHYCGGQTDSFTF